MRHLAAIIVLTLILPGCAVYDPYRVWRFSFDYNTERALSAQMGVYDHLPPKPVKFRLIRWAYNVGPSPDRTPQMIPANSPTKPTVPPLEGVIPEGTYDDVIPVDPWPIAPPLPSRPLIPPYGPYPYYPNYPLQPPLPPPLPMLPSQPLAQPFGPSAAVPPPQQGTSVTPASWLFSAP